MTDILEKIKAYKLKEVTTAKQKVPLAELVAQAKDVPPPRGFQKALENAKHYPLIAEIKKASPSKGIIRTDFNPTHLAQSYEQGGATCLSVLTDTPSFQGSPTYLIEASQASKLPILRKDFMYDPYQVVQARAMHADCILIIMAFVNDSQAQALYDTANEWNMDCLIETHNLEELERTYNLNKKPSLIGINNRNLRDFSVDIERSLKIAQNIDKDTLLVSESGITSPNHLKRLSTHGIKAYLVGEHLMRQNNVTEATKALLQIS